MSQPAVGALSVYERDTSTISGEMMSFNCLVSDAILHHFLMAQDFFESQAELKTLVSLHAEPCIKSIIIARLRNYFKHERHPDYEDLFSEAKTRLLTYLGELKPTWQHRPVRISVTMLQASPILLPTTISVKDTQHACV